MEKKLTKKELRKKGLDSLKTALFVVIGNGLLAFVVSAFIIPHDIIMGGTTGIAIVVGKYSNIDTALLILILNIILLLLGLIIIGKKLFITSVASTFLYPAMLSVIQRIPGIDSLTDNTLLASLYAGVLLGLALGLVMRVGSSTGGMDIMNLILAKLTHRPVAIFVYITDIIVVGAQALVSSSESIMMGIVVLILEAFVLDRVMIFGKAQIQLHIISKEYEQIRLKLLKELNAGLTLTYIQSGFLGKDGKGIICVIPSRKLYAATEIVKAIDPEAFMTVTKIKEVSGRGFTEERQPLTMESENE